jgi:superfamily II DNA/RNA helicase
LSPKNKKPAGGRAQNFEPRYGQNAGYQDRKRRPAPGAERPARDGAGAGRDDTGSSAGSRSPHHRGYRADAPEASSKRRWTAQEKAGRDQARAIRSGRPSRADERPSRDAGPRRDDARTGGARTGWQERGRDGRQDRFDAPRGGRDAGDARRTRPDDRPFRADRPAFRDGRPGFRDERPGFRDERPRRDDRPGFRDGRRDDRPGFREDRPGFRDERPRREDRPGFRDDRRDGRPGFRDERPRREDRPGFRDERPVRDDRERRDDRARPDGRPFRGDRRSDDRRSDDRTGRPEGRDSASRSGRDARDSRYARPTDSPAREDRSDRPRRNDRSRDDRPARGDWSDRPRRDERTFGRNERTFGGNERTFGGNERTFGGNERTFGGNERTFGGGAGAGAAHEEHVDVVHERLQAEAIQAEEVADVTFGSLGLGENIVRTLAELGADRPFPIQASTIGPILEGKDVLARGRTGSGKTIAFGAPLVESLLRAQAGQKRAFARAPKALILAPTRELALQIDRTVQPIARSVGVFTTQIYGGVPQARQVGALRKGVDIVIGTPGRIEDLIEQGKLDLSEVGIVVLDEADHMSELGFLEPMQRILRRVQDGAQKLLFSATLDREVAALVDEFLVDPAVYEVAGEDQDSGSIDHRILVIDHRDKAEILNSLVDRDGKTLVFARTRAYAEMLAEQFDDAGIRAVALHGDLNQAKRTRNLQRLTEGKVEVLVATDVAARGIHVDDIDLVIQADPPDEYKTYLHRSGRTGRAGRSGTVVTLVTRQRRRRMTELLQRAEIDAPFVEARVGDDVIEELSGRQVDPIDA